MGIDFNTATWLQIVEWCEEQLEAARRRNDADLDAAQTATIRGEIKAYKKLLGLPEAAARARSTESA